MKQTYVPTEADRLTGEQIRKLRRAAGETLAETIERSGIDMGPSSLSRTELGQRQLTMPEATKLAAHWNTTPGHIFTKPLPEFKRPAPVATEQEFLGNTKPALFAVPGPDKADVAAFDANFITIDRDAPMTPEQYRADVWIPYLENRYSTEQKAG